MYIFAYIYMREKLIIIEVSSSIPDILSIFLRQVYWPTRS